MTVSLQWWEALEMKKFNVFIGGSKVGTVYNVSYGYACEEAEDTWGSEAVIQFVCFVGESGR